MSNQLSQLRALSKVVADTGDVEAIKQFQPEDATTNPSLLLKASQLEIYKPIFAQAIQWAKAQSNDKVQQVVDASDKLSVLIGKEISDTVPGRVSTEVDARLSFDTAASVAKAERLIALYAELGVPKERVLIKLASTWEGIRAGEILESKGINCNLTLLFSFAQAKACAEAGVYLISPFVGRILDWYKKARNVDHIDIKEDPGVSSVTRIYQYYKQHGYKTIVMGASFRSTEQVLALAGCDRLTISPNLLAEMEQTEGEVQQMLSYDGPITPAPQAHSEASFRWEHNEDAMATEKLAEGIRNFAVDQNKLEVIIQDNL